MVLGRGERSVYWSSLPSVGLRYRLLLGPEAGDGRKRVLPRRGVGCCVLCARVSELCVSRKPYHSRLVTGAHCPTGLVFQYGCSLVTNTLLVVSPFTCSVFDYDFVFEFEIHDPIEIEHLKYILYIPYPGDA